MGFTIADLIVFSLIVLPFSVWGSFQWTNYSYLDKAQEAKRLAESAKPAPSTEEVEKRKELRAEKRKANAAWSDKTRRKEEREKRREKKDRKRKWEKTNTAQAGAKRGLGDVKEDEGSEGDAGDDWDELAREERIAKRVKKGHLTQTEFAAEFGDW